MMKITVKKKFILVLIIVLSLFGCSAEKTDDIEKESKEFNELIENINLNDDSINIEFSDNFKVETLIPKHEYYKNIKTYNAQSDVLINQDKANIVNAINSFLGEQLVTLDIINSLENTNLDEDVENIVEVSENNLLYVKNISFMFAGGGNIFETIDSGVPYLKEMENYEIQFVEDKIKELKKGFESIVPFPENYVYECIYLNDEFYKECEKFYDDNEIENGMGLLMSQIYENRDELYCIRIKPQIENVLLHNLNEVDSSNNSCWDAVFDKNGKLIYINLNTGVKNVEVSEEIENVFDLQKLLQTIYNEYKQYTMDVKISNINLVYIGNIENNSMINLKPYWSVRYYIEGAQTYKECFYSLVNGEKIE